MTFISDGDVPSQVTEEDFPVYEPPMVLDMGEVVAATQGSGCNSNDSNSQGFL